MTKPPQINGLYVTECASFPRSGHHFLQSLLSHLYREALVYSEYYKDARRIAADGINFQKNHDFDLVTPTDKTDRQYLVQIRSPIKSLVSWYILDTTSGGLEDTLASWRNFAVQRAGFWAHFYAKWVIKPIDNRLVVIYEDLVSQPHAWLETIAGFLSGPGSKTAAEIRACLEARPIITTAREKTFHYYDRGFYRALEEVIEEELLLRVGIKRGQSLSPFQAP